MGFYIADVNAPMLVLAHASPWAEKLMLLASNARAAPPDDHHNCPK
jgi:hypothetical protein